MTEHVHYLLHTYTMLHINSLTFSLTAVSLGSAP